MLERYERHGLILERTMYETFTVSYDNGKMTCNGMVNCLNDDSVDLNSPLKKIHELIVKEFWDIENRVPNINYRVIKSEGLSPNEYQYVKDLMDMIDASINLDEIIKLKNNMYILNFGKEAMFDIAQFADAINMLQEQYLLSRDYDDEFNPYIEITMR